MFNGFNDAVLWECSYQQCLIKDVVDSSPQLKINYVTYNVSHNNKENIAIT